MTEDLTFTGDLRKRFLELPKVVQDAITSAQVEKHLRELAERHRLHLDQWQVLENEVMLALLGFLPVEELEGHMREQVGVSPEVATALSIDISHNVFEPIRESLERELEHPEAKTVN